jgi:general secretion pathway protein H
LTNVLISIQYERGKKMNKRGVTLVELVVVFVIIAIGAALIAPNIGAWLPSYRLRSATRDVVSILRTAQIRAVSNNIQYRVDFNVAPNSYKLQRNSGGWADDGAVQTVPAGITINIDNLGGGTALFNPDSTSSGGRVTLQNTKGSTRTITLTTVTGRVNVS